MSDWGVQFFHESKRALRRKLCKLVVPLFLDLISLACLRCSQAVSIVLLHENEN